MEQVVFVPLAKLSFWVGAWLPAAWAKEVLKGSVNKVEANKTLRLMNTCAFAGFHESFLLPGKTKTLSLRTDPQPVCVHA